MRCGDKVCQKVNLPLVNEINLLIRYVGDVEGMLFT